jgi:hypothetical protein
MERLIDGDEGLLALDGIGPKALTEIKTRSDAVALPEPEEEKPESELPGEPEPEVVPMVEAMPVPAETLVVEGGVAEEMVTEAVDEDLAADVEPKAAPEIEVEPEIEGVIAVEPEPAIDEAQRQAELEQALAQIPADAYDIPLAVLALSGQILGHLRDARIENLGQIMERLVYGDEVILGLTGIDKKALDEIKTQVEIMVSIPSPKEPQFAAEEEPERDTARFPRFEYVPDDELEQKTKSRPRRRQKQRRPFTGTEWEDDAEEPVGVPSYDDWDEFDDS